MSSPQVFSSLTQNMVIALNKWNLGATKNDAYSVYNSSGTSISFIGYSGKQSEGGRNNYTLVLKDVIRMRETPSIVYGMASLVFHIINELFIKAINIHIEMGRMKSLWKCEITSCILNDNLLWAIK